MHPGAVPWPAVTLATGACSYPNHHSSLCGMVVETALTPWFNLEFHCFSGHRCSHCAGRPVPALPFCDCHRCQPLPGTWDRVCTKGHLVGVGACHACIPYSAPFSQVQLLECARDPCRLLFMRTAHWVLSLAPEVPVQPPGAVWLWLQTNPSIRVSPGLHLRVLSQEF